MIPVPLSRAPCPPCPTLPVPDPHCTPTERLRGGDAHGLPPALHQRGRAGWGRETGKGQGGSLGQAGPLALRACVARTVGSVPSPSCLCRLPPADMLSLQSQEEVHKKIQHPEVSQDPGASYPLGRGMGTGSVGGGGRWAIAGSPLSLGSLMGPSRPEALLRGQDTKQQTHHLRQLPAEGPGPPGICLAELQ